MRFSPKISEAAMSAINKRGISVEEQTWQVEHNDEQNHSKHGGDRQGAPQ